MPRFKPAAGAPVVLFIACVLSFAHFSFGQVNNEQITAAVKKAVAWVYGRQNSWGTWEAAREPSGIERDLPDQGQFGMKTALAMQALLAAGEDQTQDRLQSPVDFLITSDRIDGVYAVSMRSRVWPLLTPTPAVRQAMARDRNLLLHAMHLDGRTRGLFSYRTDFDSEPEYADHALSFYATTGMKVLADGGMEVPESFWRIGDRAWRTQQGRDGSWAIGVGGPTSTHQARSLSMTACGVAVLLAGGDELAASRPADCKGPPADRNVENGLNWIDSHFDQSREDFNLAGFKLKNFGLYALARIGAISGRKYFNQRDWYQDGAQLLIDSQNRDGSWDNLPDTCLGILFLERGRKPVIVSKLQYDVISGHSKTPRQAAWNLRPRDMANLTSWFSRQFESDYNWQTVSLKVPVEELHDSAVLYMAGNQPLKLAAEDKAKLKDFIVEGGLLVGNADCASAAFSDGFRKLGTELFPDYEFRALPRDSVIYTHEPFRADKWKFHPQVLELSNGVRDLMLLFPQDDPSRFFQMNFVGGREYLYGMMSDILLYGADQSGLRLKGQSYIARPDSGARITQTVKVARLQYNGNWNPEPGGWVRLAAVMHNTRGIDIQVDSIRPGEGKLDRSFRIAHLTGTGNFHLREDAIRELRQFIRQGGTIVIDAAGGKQSFDAAAQDLIKSIVPDDPLEVLSSDHLVYSSGRALDRPSYRRFERSRLSDPSSFRLQGVDVGGGRTGLFYSPEDLSAGLVGEPIDGVYGYQPATAAALMANMIEYAARER